MSYKTALIALGFAASAVLAAAAFAQNAQAPSMPADLARMAQSAQTRMAESAQSRYLPEYTDSADMKLPPNSIWREWVFVGDPLTPNALNGGHAGFQRAYFPTERSLSRNCSSPWGLRKTRMAHEQNLRVGVTFPALSTAP